MKLINSENPAHQICINCVMDTTDSLISFDDNGVCDHCISFSRSVLPNWLSNFDTLIIKMDIEGAEFDLLDSENFSKCAMYIDILCIEFHHRWRQFGVHRLRKAVDKLKSLGFECVWRNSETNEEFTFVRITKRTNNNERLPAN